MRLFVGLELPERVKQALPLSRGKIPGARWQKKHQLHLTLRFIGHVGNEQAEQIKEALSVEQINAFSIRLKGTGYFGAEAQPKVLWTGAAPHEPLEMLHSRLNEQLAALGIEPQKQPYQPHVTLARLKHGSEQAQQFLRDYSALETPGFEVDWISLFASTALPDGVYYNVLKRYPLRELPKSNI